MKKILLVITIIIVCGALALIVFNKKKDFNNQDYLIKVVYDSSGDMRGSVYNVTLLIKDKNIIVKEKDTYDDPFTIKEYTVSEEDINKIKQYISENKFPEWEKYEMDERLFAYDAASKDITFEYDTNELDYYTVNLNVKLNAKQRSKLNEFISFFLKLPNQGKLVKEYISEEDY